MTITTDIPLGGWQADVASLGDTGSSTSLVLAFNQTVPVGTVLVAAIQSGGFSSVSGTDTQGNTWTSQVTSNINGASIHLVVWTCVVTTQLTTADSVTFTFTSGNSAGARAGVVSAYMGVSTTTPVDSGVSAGNQANPGTTLTVTGAGADSIANEIIYVAWDLQNTTGGIIWDPSYQLRTSATSVGTIRTVQPTDNVVTSTGTYNSVIGWANSANVSGAILGLELVAIPPVVTTIPSGTEGGRETDDAGTSKVTVTASGVNTKQTTDSGTATVGISAAASSEIYTAAGGGSSTDLDSGTATIGFDQSASFEVFTVNDAATMLVRITVPQFSGPIDYIDGLQGTTSELALWELGVGELSAWQYANGTTNFVKFTPGGTFPQVLLNPCISVTLRKRFTVNKVGRDVSATAHKHLGTTVKKNWRVVNSGKCLA